MLWQHIMCLFALFPVIFSESSKCKVQQQKYNICIHYKPEQHFIHKQMQKSHNMNRI